MSTASEQIDRIRSLFDEVLRMDPRSREARLDDACRNDDELRLEIESLLETYQRTDDIMQDYEELFPGALWDRSAAVEAADPYELVGRHFNQYEIRDWLGRGGMGLVYVAYDTTLDRMVALKLLPPELTRDPDARLRFLNEARAAAALDHPNICAVHEIGVIPHPPASEQPLLPAGQGYIAMSFYDGETLKKKIAHGRLAVEAAIDIVGQICAGLAVAHAAGIVHRDIKPANIMITDEGVVKIVDFGLAKLAGSAGLTTTGTTMGTVAYMSPEQAGREKVDHRTDIWSLGVVLYEMLTGEQPFAGDCAEAVLYSIRHDAPPSLHTARPEVPDHLVTLVERCLSKAAASRPDSVMNVLAELDAVRTSMLDASPVVAETVSPLRLLRRPRVALPGIILLLMLSALVLWRLDHSKKVSWARYQALPDIVRLAEESDYGAAFALATEAEQYIPGDSMLMGLWPLMSGYRTVRSDPLGADVYMRPYTGPDALWQYLGQTPVDSLRVSFETYRFKLEKEGYSTVEAIPRSWTNYYTLDREGSIPAGMVRVSGSTLPVFLSGFSQRGRESVGEFLIDRYEVTNQKYKRFVDGGGYRTRDFWKQPFVSEGRTLSWQEAMGLFTDKTGQPGPATWEVSSYPVGEDDYPVTGVSWYEAAAYAEFVGKSLPTIYHWNSVAGIGWQLTDLSRLIVPQSNFDGRGPAPVGSYRGMGPWGTYDLAGNVREWTWNQVQGTEQRFILGGGWNDPAYMYTSAYGARAFDRSSTNGFRCIKYLGVEPPAVLSRPLALVYRDYYGEEPVSDEVFEVFLRQYAYDPAPLNASVEEVDASAEGWTREKITFDAAYGDERMVAYLYLPTQGTPPYQAEVLFPGAWAIHARSFEPWLIGLFDFILRSGRAVMLPIYMGTYERGDDLQHTPAPSETNVYRDHVIMWAKDLSRSIDYLETRYDVDTEKLAFLGYSSGASVGPIMLAVEKRINVGVLANGGLGFLRSLPEADPFNYLPRVTVPVLMLNGRYDFVFPIETSQRPMFELLGTREEDKRHAIFATSHGVPRADLIRETLAWLDRYLGPVELDELN